MRTFLKDSLIYKLISAFVSVKFPVFLTPRREKQYQITYVHASAKRTVNQTSLHSYYIPNKFSN